MLAPRRYRNYHRKLKARAKRRGLKYNLNVKYIKSLEVDRCPYFFCKLQYLSVPEGVRRPDDLATIDRIDAKQGYIKGNVCIISNKANHFKSIWERK